MAPVLERSISPTYKRSILVDHMGEGRFVRSRGIANPLVEAVQRQVAPRTPEPAGAARSIRSRETRRHRHVRQHPPGRALRRDKEPQASDRELAKLVEQARADGLELVGENGLLGRLTKLVLESALEGEITGHLGYDEHERGGSQTGNARNGTRANS
ncbi:transposase [Microbispora bryophytorum]|uniref:transposase n=1 Tax=Microbispora bryophytorum TaxID=1460882 RepID=UPI0033CEBC9A